MKKAFTLVELLVVIAIMAILVGIFIPSLQSAKNKAKKNQNRLPAQTTTSTPSTLNRFNVGDKVEITSLGVDGSVQSVIPNGVSGVNYIVTYKLPNGELKNIEVSEFQIRFK